ncbi:acyltransferase family protein [Chitinophaga nivalis]|uniref:Acyltransferase n=1 Tax=Chitinophaga nivalis TaxID=2991709 RepID=A0ABT3ILQ7_9BACT|nr:acyltransferase [Chitinophaga nivalis]MCW3465410.1 acyltransferase [Chitinophaga nivalis]MCW3484898.1 acyltransferase [Chitinophaga nivalis]
MKLFNLHTINSTGRLAWIDYARAIAIILVLYRHIFEGLSRAALSQETFAGLEHANIIFYSFRMPLFFILSGAFIAKSLQRKGVAALIRNKFDVLFYPYVLWATLQITIQLLLSHFVNASRSLIDYTYIFTYPRNVDQFWYLLALFNVSVLYIFTRARLRLSIYWQLALGIAMYLYSDYLSVQHTDVGLLYDILHFYVFFALGDFIGHQLLDEKNTARFSSWWLFLSLLPVFVAGQYYFLQKNLAMENHLFVEHHQPLLFAAIAISGCAFIYNVSFILQRYQVLKFLRVIGHHSLYIYLTHVLIASATRILLVKLFGITYLPLLLTICIITAIIISIALYNIAMHYGCWWLYSLERPKNKLQQPAPVIIKHTQHRI